MIALLVVLYVVAGLAVGDLVTVGWGPGWVRRALLAALVWPLLAAAALVGLVRELRR